MLCLLKWNERFSKKKGPSEVTKKKAIEMIQRRAVRFVSRNYIYEEGVVTGLIRERGWVSLEGRRRAARLGLMFKMWKGEVALDFNQYFSPRTVKLLSVTKYSYNGFLINIFNLVHIIQSKPTLFYSSH